MRVILVTLFFENVLRFDVLLLLSYPPEAVMY